MNHTISVLVENRLGVLARVSGLFSGRGYNIDSLCVGETDDPMISRMTIVTHGDNKIIEQIEKQLNKLIDVIKVMDVTKEDHVERELVLIKVGVDEGQRGKILEIVEIFRGKVIDVSPKTITVEITGDEGKINGITEMLKPFGVKELVRTGKVAVVRGEK
ncbi:acetolactate synthase small subunit [Candidatus Desantisbacteria bacterium CG2_30_40_21]|uniref:Acetolactate synthase small subunit n=5 Tax=unclassified Candidatus Desantisiibacteriota TaxID=3106372 RepID=A0A2M7JBI4_9BACT|nr:MAG: acetolactate synthase small subunit [Candidatus Desantisbacteria bacterium CG2_30_40_21]PIP40468.1 MAG: acetolactate synthase small subunit [Candidatus Desantisbacteria bacterium CG23_combo_of_CG06-09_8_20_14_all_40_23]PIX16734.1 MAG: acetolactate synthase small subunit [Candidatus Desantisbacteria bacterium CG_4_8_14_3_um_filter_40_12]PIY20552.1 MAG: acetolactate synthase small subunit [Candidatus Desantisbacteria bacterium CG_4_10_14_3_um_filter_40_18]PJB28469.1 MAG: acetolactate synt